MQRLCPEALVHLVVLPLIAPESGEALRAPILVYVGARQNLSHTLNAVHHGYLRSSSEGYAELPGRLEAGNARTELTHCDIVRRDVLPVAVAFLFQHLCVVKKPLS